MQMTRSFLEPRLLIAYAVFFALTSYAYFTIRIFRMSETSLDSDLQKAHHQHQRLAIAQFIENRNEVLGAFSAHSQMIKFNMTKAGIEHIIVVPETFNKSDPIGFQALTAMVGQDTVRVVDHNYIFDKLQGGIWKGPFNKLWLFNLTDYDKLIILDPDVLIRTNIEHWFQYNTPCGSQQNDKIIWNSGAMVITPDSKVFARMVDLLPQVRTYVPGVTNHSDGVNSAHGQQGFLSSIFTAKDVPPTLRMKTMPSESAVLSSRLSLPQYEYFNLFRRHIYETVHLTVHKPWKDKTYPSHPMVCDMLREWQESVQGIERYNISSPDGYLAKCPPPSLSSHTGKNMWSSSLNVE